MSKGSCDKSHIVVIPTLNEAKHIANILNVANSAAMPATEGEEPSLVIVADGGSTDGTLDIVDAHARDAPSKALASISL